MNRLLLSPEFIQGIDWSKFKEQRKSLYAVIDFLSENEGSKQTVNDLDGLMSLLDSICDYAVDVCQLEEKTIFIQD